MSLSKDDNSERLRYRKNKSRIMIGLCAIALLVAMVPLGAILFEVTSKGLSALSWEFLTALPSVPGTPGGGIRNAIVGTIAVVIISSLISIPIGIASGIYLSEFGTGRFARGIRFLTEVLSSVPSIITGVIVYGYVVVPMGQASALAGGIALSILSIPWITVATEDALGLVPDSYRDASLALGVDRTSTTLQIVLPSAVGGIISGTMLGVARVAGETAPLLLTVGNSTFPFAGVREATATMSVDIYLYATSPYESWNRQAWGAAVLLLLFVLGTNILARTLWNARSRSMRGD